MTREIMYPPAKRDREAALNPYLRYVLRPPSFPLAVFLHARGISADQVTVASGVLLGLSLLVGACAPLAGGAATGVFVLAVLGINIYWFMDTLDGNIARLAQQESPFGQYLENALYLTAGFATALLAGWFAVMHAPIAEGWEQTTGLPALALAGLGILTALARLYRRALLEMGERILDKTCPPEDQDLSRLSGPMRLLYAVSGAHLPLLLLAALLHAVPVWLVFYAALTTATIIYAPVSVLRRLRKRPSPPKPTQPQVRP